MMDGEATVPTEVKHAPADRERGCDRRQEHFLRPRVGVPLAEEGPVAVRHRRRGLLRVPWDVHLDVARRGLLRGRGGRLARGRPDGLPRRQLLQVHLLHVAAEHVLSAVPGRHAAEDHAVQQRVATQAVVAVHAARELPGGIEALDDARRLEDARLGVDLQATHAIVDHRRDDRHVERLGGDLRAGNDIVVELLARAGLAAGLVPRLARGVCGPRAALGVLGHLLRGLVVLVVGVDEGLQRHAHVLGQRRPVLVELHHAAARVMLAVPGDLIGSILVQR
mmetsp:Transcript_123636/g.332066  ORF Transcript_123636/g.332066 Transcript_123636/m.332066 type:complete len:279 (+) Transcript_123636:392-1228(+)